MSLHFPTVRQFLSDPTRYEKAFFACVSLPNGTFKTTHAGRFDDLNHAVLPLLKEIPGPLQMMDVAASSGISTAEWLNQVKSSGIACSITAGDLLTKASLVKVSGLELLVDTNGNIIHIDVGRFGLPARVKSAKRLLITPFRFISQLAYRTFPSQHIQDVPLVVPYISAVNDDITAPNPAELVRSFNVLRAANILNLNYFSNKMLVCMIATLKERLREGGVFIVCRSVSDGENHATAYTLRNGRFVERLRLGGGSEIDHLIRRT